MHNIDGVNCEVKKAVERDQKGNLPVGGSRGKNLILCGIVFVIFLYMESFC